MARDVFALPYRRHGYESVLERGLGADAVAPLAMVVDAVTFALFVLEPDLIVP